MRANNASRSAPGPTRARQGSPSRSTSTTPTVCWWRSAAMRL